jgi:hypothetical protein
MGIGAVLALEGLVGTVAPELFRALVVWLQAPAVWPASVVARLVLAGALFARSASIRSPGTVTVVGVITLISAVVGAVASSPETLSAGTCWRIPAVALCCAGLAVIWASGAGSSRPNNSSKPTPLRGAA